MKQEYKEKIVFPKYWSCLILLLLVCLFPIHADGTNFALVFDIYGESTFRVADDSGKTIASGTSIGINDKTSTSIGNIMLANGQKKTKYTCTFSSANNFHVVQNSQQISYVMQVLLYGSETAQTITKTADSISYTLDSFKSDEFVLANMYAKLDSDSYASALAGEYQDTLTLTFKAGS